MGAGSPKSLCLITALAPVPAFLGGSCPLGCSLSAPATGGFSVVSLQCNMYAAGSEKEKRAGGPLHGGTIAHPFVFCKWGITWTDGFVWPAPSFMGGLAWPAPLYHRPTLQRFWKQGDSPCTPGGGCAPCTLPGERRRRCSLAWRVGMLPNQGKGKNPLLSLPPSTGAGTEGGTDRGDRLQVNRAHGYVGM